MGYLAGQGIGATGCFVFSELLRVDPFLDKLNRSLNDCKIYKESRMCLAVPGQIEAIYDADAVRMGKVSFGGVRKEVCLAYLSEVEVGDYVIVHVGFAISKIDEQAALETLQTFRQLGILEDELTDLRQTGEI
jgi:hydrogenase expression/formation protein HypC